MNNFLGIFEQYKKVQVFVFVIFYTLKPTHCAEHFAHKNCEEAETTFGTAFFIPYNQVPQVKSTLTSTMLGSK